MQLLTATSYSTLSSGSGTFTVPEGANAIHIQAGVGGGGGAAGGVIMIKQVENLQVLVVDQVLMYLTKYLLLPKVKQYLIQLVGVELQEIKQLILVNLNGVQEQYNFIWINSRIIIYIRSWRRISGTGGGVQGPLRTNTAGTAGSATIGGSRYYFRKF